MVDKALDPIRPTSLAPVDLPKMKAKEIVKELGGGIAEVNTDGVEPFNVVEFFGSWKTPLKA
jgi:hypothetical protein